MTATRGATRAVQPALWCQSHHHADNLNTRCLIGTVGQGLPPDVLDVPQEQR